MTYSIEKHPKTEWLLVKVPQIRNDSTGSNATEKMLRETIRNNHFGGEEAVVAVSPKSRSLHSQECPAMKPHDLRTAHAASLASQRQTQQLNAYWDRLYWIRETTRLYWELPRI